MARLTNHLRNFSELSSYLNEPGNWVHARCSLPRLSENRLEQARNGKIGTEANNDLMEFVGDRIVNLMCALVAAKDSFCPDQQVVVDRAVSNNDTLGRLAYQLQLHKHAHLDDINLKRVADWSPRYHTSPPKDLADLFEAYVGAVYEEHGWDVTKDWLETLLKPLIGKATEDYLERPRTTPERGVYVSHELLDDLEHQEKIYDYLEFRAKNFVTVAEPALCALPQSTKFVFGANGDIGNDRDMVEVATHLVKFWVCQIFMSLYPENRKALFKGPHLASSITVLVTNTWTLGFLGSLLKLGSFFDIEDPDFSLFDMRLKSPRSTTTETKHHEAIIRSKLTQAVYAMIGWYHYQDSKAAMKWGIKWFTPLVTRAHDIITEDPSFKPCLPHGASDTLAFHAAALQVIQNSQDIISVSREEELEVRFLAMIIRDKEIRKLGFNPGVAANHRLTIDLDDDDDDENTSNEPHDEPDPCNEASLVEGLIPSLANLKITPIERERAQGSRAVGLIHSKGVSKAIKLILHSDIPFGSPALAREVEEISKDSVSAPTQEEPTSEEPLSNVTNQSFAKSNDNEPRSTEPPREPKAARNEKPVVLPMSQKTIPPCRKPPREPRAMREHRSREKRVTVARKQGFPQASLEHPKPEEKENDSRACGPRWT